MTPSAVATPSSSSASTADLEFDALDLEELAVLDVSDAVAMPEMGASHGSTACCSSSSSSSSCCCC